MYKANICNMTFRKTSFSRKENTLKIGMKTLNYDILLSM